MTLTIEKVANGYLVYKDLNFDQRCPKKNQFVAETFEALVKLIKKLDTEKSE